MYYQVFYVPYRQDEVIEKIKYLLKDVKVHVFKRIKLDAEITKAKIQNVFSSYIVVEIKNWEDKFYYLIRKAGAKRLVGEITEEEFRKMKRLEGVYIDAPEKPSFEAIIEIIEKIKKKIKAFRQFYAIRARYFKKIKEVFFPISFKKVLKHFLLE